MASKKENDPKAYKKKKKHAYFCIAYSRYFSKSTHRMIVGIKNHIKSLGSEYK